MATCGYCGTDTVRCEVSHHIDAAGEVCCEECSSPEDDRIADIHDEIEEICSSLLGSVVLVRFRRNQVKRLRQLVANL